MSDEVSVVFNPNQGDDEYYITNDSVMGGLSKGNIKLIDDVMCFSGDISKENNGGFTSVFQKITLPSDNIHWITIRVVGDGNRYQLRIKGHIMGYEQGYKIDFITNNNASSNVYETHTFKLSDFQASVKGRIISNAPMLMPSAISHVGFLINSAVPTRFKLSIHDIEFH